MRQINSAVLVLALALGCDGGGDGPTGGNGGNTPTDLALVSGDGQRVAVSATLLSPFVVRVTDAGGNGVSGVSVSWQVTAGGGSLSANSVTTDLEGRASVVLTSGGSEGQNTVTATASGLSGSPVTFTATAVTPAAIAVAGGNNQTARISQPLASALAVSVTADDGGPVPAATVNWEVTAGGGALSAASSTTRADGRASVGLTLGGNVGGNGVTATIAGVAGPSAAFNADGTSPLSVTVTLLNIAFNAPGGGDDVTIMLGDTVRWVNAESTTHTATSSSVPAGGDSFDSNSLSLNDEFFFVPNVRGAWVYFCEFHPVQMRDARIDVE